ncbi:complex I subunit 5 family protein [Bradyrhizobium japonicum]|uniref:complex I subunit 5 family protein n=1 Tax=Bradyrhizobium japonicum TaxID=375 RepID=UPI002714D5F4|nr:proton-conducting transporter membrane subunit [Bradyrhizobium japonicum]WLB56590.1 proton-conducting transporter membrane subunit [Bradyrhizobium japonicum]WLB61517.1 proton-conducting transporter membrane subunit [Bradyrhizobium japonicum]
MLPPAPALVTTAGGFLLVLSIVVPVAGVLLAFALGQRYVRQVASTVVPVGLAIALAVLVLLPRSDGHLVYLLGAWPPPLGVALRADGLSAVMLATTAVVICAVAIFAATDFRPQSAEARASFAFWILLLAIWGALNTIFVAGDLFTLYVALELLTFAAVPLVSLDGRAETLRAALRYLLFALLGSVLYLMGTALLYGLYGTLDIELLSQRVSADSGVLIAAALMTTGLLAKTALFPLHLWLPPAHAGAPPAASAILSALVVKGSFFILVRLWFDVMPGLPGLAAAQLLATLGAGAILFGSVVALRQERLKLLIAYSTLAQIGYLFLMFPLAFGASGKLESDQALAGGLLQAVSHATAKAAMFMAVGSIYTGLGHDRITGLRGVARALPLSVLAFAIGGIALIGVQPSGASLAKELLLQDTARTGQWWWAVVLQAGGMFTTAYVVLVLSHALAPSDQPIALVGPAPLSRDLAALALALCSLFLGLLPWDSYLPVPYDATSKLFGIDALSKLLLPVLGGAAFAILLSPWPHPLGSSAAWKALMRGVGPLRRGCLRFGSLVERSDEVLCQWSAAGISLLLVSLLLAASMLAAN